MSKMRTKKYCSLDVNVLFKIMPLIFVKLYPTCMVIMLMNSISFMRIITIASCVMFVSGLFKITEPKIVYSIE